MIQKLQICPTCNKEFAITNSMSRQKFCSHACRPEKIRYVGDKKCEQCGIVYAAKFAEQKCCSEKCRCIQISEKRTKAPLIRNCVKCGVQFSTKKKTKRFCSVKCSSAQFDPVTLTCETCKKQFTVPYRHRGLKTCGRKCMGIRSSKLHNTDVIVCCFVCGTNYTVPIAARNTNKYCSYDCFNSTTEAAQPDILKICETCNVEFSVSATKSEQRFCCKSCAFTGENNAAFGKPSHFAGKPAWNRGLTVETDERLRLLGEKISVLSKEQFRTGVRDHKGENNPMFNHVTTEEQRQNHSKAAIKRVLDGFSGYKTGHLIGEYVSNKTGKMMKFKSSWELAVMMSFDENDKICWYEYEPDIIKLKNHRHAIPDFFVVTDECRFYLEIKPTQIQMMKTVTEKLSLVKEAIAELGYEYQVWGDDEIKLLVTELGEKYSNAINNYQNRE